MNRFKVVLCAAAGAAIFASVVLWPILVHPNGFLSAYDHPGDAMISIWSSWVRLQAEAGEIALDRVTWVNYPDGIDFKQNPPEPAIEWPLTRLSRWFGEVTAYQIVLWTTFPLAAATAALLIWELTALPWAAVMGGLLYALAPYHFARSIQITLASIQWLPLGLWCWVWLSKRPSWKRAGVHAVCSALIALTTAYYGYLYAVASVVFFVGLMLQQKSSRQRFDFLKWAAAAVCGAGASLLVWYGPFLAHMTAATDVSFQTRYGWPIKHLFVYCAKPWDYFLPAIHHPLWGKQAESFLRAHLYGSNVIEQTLFLGYAVTAMAVAAVWGMRRQSGRTSVWLLVATGVVALWFSGPPLIPMGPFTIENDQVIAPFALYFPSWWMHHLFLSPLRVYARFGLLVLLASAALAGIFWEILLRKRQWGWCIVLGVWMIVDYALVMPMVSISETPSIYAWLKNQPADAVIAEYPYVPGNRSIHAEYLFYQRVHRKPMINGGYERILEAGQSPERAGLVDLTAPGVVDHLRQRGVRYVVVHRDFYQRPLHRPKQISVLGVRYDVPQRHADEEIPPPPKIIPGLVYLQSFGATDVYEIAS